MCCGRETVRSKHVIGFLHWELPRIPAGWLRGLRFLHEIWVPSLFCAEAIRPYFTGPVRIIPHPVDVEGVRKAPAGNRFTVLTMFNVASSFERKNPLATIRAFKAAFGADPAAHLVIKIHNPSHYPAGLVAMEREIAGAGNITLIDAVMSRHEVLELIAAADAVISLHRSEGFGLLAAEAMLIGVPVIATDWSATAEFVTPETGIPIPYKMIPAIDPQGPCHYPDQRWADPDVAAATSALRRLRDDKDYAATLAERGRIATTAMFARERYVALVRQALTEAADSVPDVKRQDAKTAS